MLISCSMYFDSYKSTHCTSILNFKNIYLYIFFTKMHMYFIHFNWLS